MMAEAVRLDGWKAIARHLGRDRSTVIRWAKERGLPVHSFPGGKSRTVFALRDELEEWMRGSGATAADPDPSAEPADPVIEPTIQAVPPLEPASKAPAHLAIAVRPAERGIEGARRKTWIIASVVTAALLLLFGLYHADRRLDAHSPATIPALDPATRATLLEVQDDIASRSEPRLNQAIARLRSIRRDHPELHAALAEAYLLAREFGSLPDGPALERARAEAMRALTKDGREATALRVMGVISYWRDRDPRAAGGYFRRAIAAAPGDALAHQWYANILSDNGENAAALAGFDQARRLNPGAPHLLADYAWALWSAGRDAEAKALLDDLARRYPTLASVHDCLSVIAFADGDLAGYARHLRLRALARKSPELLAYADLVNDTAERGHDALYRVMTARAIAQADGSPEADLSWPAFVASRFDDRARLLRLLRRSLDSEQRWGASGYTSRMRRRWSSDPEVLAGLDRLAQPRIAI